MIAVAQPFAGDGMIHRAGRALRTRMLIRTRRPPAILPWRRIPDNAHSMSISLSTLRLRLGAMLCILLVMLFAGMGLSRTMDGIQHEAGATQRHAHMLFSGLTAEEAHDAQHDRAEVEDQDRSNRLPDGHHHHHGDGGAGVILLAQAGLMAPLFDSARHGLPQERGGLGSAVRGPERPPRAMTDSV